MVCLQEMRKVFLTELIATSVESLLCWQTVLGVSVNQHLPVYLSLRGCRSIICSNTQYGSISVVSTGRSRPRYSVSVLARSAPRYPTVISFQGITRAALDCTTFARVNVGISVDREAAQSLKYVRKRDRPLHLDSQRGWQSTLATRL